MLRINLLPREVLEKRRYEKWYRWVFFLFIGLLAIVLLFYAYLLLAAQAKYGDLQQLTEQSSKLKAQADAFGIFEQKEQDLAKREAVAQIALAGRVNMGQIANEVSLVLPDEVWLNTMTLSQTDGLDILGYTPQSASQSMDVGYKSVAKTLVRLNELPDLADVWLKSAANAQFTGYAVNATLGTPNPVNTVQFEASAKIVRAAASAPTTSSSVPAPPSSGSK